MSILKNIAWGSGLLLQACALPQPVDEEARDFSITAPRGSAAGSEAARERESGREVYSDLIRGMLKQRQFYAALAHIQEQQRALGGAPPAELRLLEAEARRELGQHAHSERLYRGLLTSAYDAEAYHGLGLLYAPRDLDQAVGHLRQAVQRRPTSVEARNDLGYALMLAGRYTEALPEFATAIELDPAGDKARNNLVILLLLTGDEAGVKRVTAEAQLPAETLARLRKQAQSLKVNRGGR